MKSLLTWIKFKGWFIFDLPYYIKENKFNDGLELGAKAGRSMYYMLKVNHHLHLAGIDIWEVIEGGAYRDNNKNQEKCIRKLSKFKNRVNLIKGDAKQIALDFPDASLDFVYYDLQCKLMSSFHQEMIEAWIPKIKKGGVLIGRDFREFRASFYNLGFSEEDFNRCTIGNRISERLEYIKL
jgi:predicted O-methyltransferase YrrM